MLFAVVELMFCRCTDGYDEAVLIGLWLVDGINGGVQLHMRFGAFFFLFWSLHV